jgi:16S rRNA (cytosine967-C5)-methyltransferase
MDDPAGGGIEDPADRASVELSHPRWLLERWSAFLGESESRALALANNQSPRAAFRVNLLKATVEEVTGALEKQGVAARESEYVAAAFVVDGEKTPLVQAAEQGLIYLQDEASQLVSMLLDPREGERILDMCAAPGSKTSHIAALTKNKSWIVACDVRPQRLSTLRSTCERLGVEQVDVVGLDGTRELPFLYGAPRFDRVLVDAPCTGTGTLSQNPEIKWRLAADDAERLSESQLRLLRRGAEMVAAGGRLVYSTCSVERDENEAVVEEFLGANRQFFRLIEPKAQSELITSEGYVRTFRHRHGMDCFFAAVMERH